MGPSQITVVLAALSVLAGCGSGGPRTTAAPTTSQVRAEPVARSIPAPAGATPIVMLPALGELSYRCAGTGEVAAMLRDGPAPATGATVTVEGDRGAHLHPQMTVTGPTASWMTAMGRYGSLTWRIIVTDEPRTVVATVRLHFHLRTTSGAEAGCGLRSWSLTSQVIEHDQKWSNPSPWA